MNAFTQTQMYQKPATCAGCSLEFAGVGFTQPKLAPIGSTLVITDAVGSHDIRQGSPLTRDSDSGWVLERAFRLAGLSPESFGFASLVACKPPYPLPKQVYEFSAPETCSTRHLKPYIDHLRPKSILALGPVVARALTGLSGEKLTIDMIRGFVLPGIGVAKGIPVIPTTSPEWVAGGMHHEMSLLVLDLLKASKTSQLPEDMEAEEYLLHVSGTAAQARAAGRPAYHSLEFFRNELNKDPNRIVVYDFEFLSASGQRIKRNKISTDAYITQVNLTMIYFDGGNGAPKFLTMVAAWNNDTKDIAIEILQSPNSKVSYNGYHVDEHVALYNGFEILGKEHHDAMWLVHFLYPDLPGRRSRDNEDFLTGDDGALMALQVAASLFDFPAPWKHLSGKDAHFYGARDSHATAVVFLGAMSQIAKRNVFGTYTYFVRELRERLKLAEHRGYPMSRSAIGDMQDEIKKMVTEINARIQTLVPDDLKPYTERKPRNDSEVAKLVDQYGSALFKTEKLKDVPCECGTESLGMPAPACPTCGGSGQTEHAPIKCKKCAKHKLHKPDETHERWYCEHCEWSNQMTPEAMEAYIVENGKPKKLSTFFRMRHDDDIRANRYLCPVCKNEGKQPNLHQCSCTKRFNYDPYCTKCHGKGTYKATVPTYCIRAPFNPNSHDQLKRYAQAHRHNIPKSGLGRDGIAQLARQKGDPLYVAIHDIKMLESVAGVMAPLLSIASVKEDGDDIERIHTHFMYTDAAGAISSVDPDIITPPPAHRYPKLAELWSKCLVSNPTPDTHLERIEYGPLELEMFALEAQDGGLLAVVPHAYDFLLDISKFRRSTHSRGAIAAIYRAFIEGAAAQPVYQRYRHLFQGPDTVAYLLGKLESTFPRCVEYRRMQANQAHKNGFLRSRFGFQREFYAVLRRREGSSDKLDPGSDYGNAVSFVARNHAACVIAMAIHGLPPEVHLISPIENEFGPCGLLVEVPNELTGAWSIPRPAPGLTTPSNEVWAAAPPVSLEISTEMK